MKKELEKSLRHMQSHPTTGTPHNQQVISTQVETIFAIDKLLREIKALSKNISDSNQQSEKLEQSNYKLQIAMLFLSFIAITVTAYQIFNSLIQTTIFAILLTLITSIITFFIGKKFVKNIDISLKESVRINDKLNIVLKDKNGKIKDTR